MIRLGIQVLHGRTAHPQTQGKVERVHRTLQADLLQAASYPDLGGWQHALDAWRAVYNQERPHQALELAVPASRYHPSPRPFPAELPAIS